MRNCHHHQPSQTHTDTHTPEDKPLYWEPGGGHLWLDGVTQQTVNTRGCICASPCDFVRRCNNEWARLCSCGNMNASDCGTKAHACVAAVPRGLVSPRTESFPARLPSGRSSSGQCWPGCSLLRRRGWRDTPISKGDLGVWATTSHCSQSGHSKN